MLLLSDQRRAAERSLHALKDSLTTNLSMPSAATAPGTTTTTTTNSSFSSSSSSPSTPTSSLTSTSAFTTTSIASTPPSLSHLGSTSLLGAYPRILSSVLAQLLGEAVISASKASSTDTAASEQRVRSASNALIRETQGLSFASLSGSSGDGQASSGEGQVIEKHELGKNTDHDDDNNKQAVEEEEEEEEDAELLTNEPLFKQYEEARRLLAMREARQLFGRLLTLRRARPCILDVRCYKALCGLLTEALQLASAAHEAQLCSLLMNMACTFYRPATGGARHFPCTDSTLRKLPVWQETRYWEECLFDALVREREGLVQYKERFWRDMSVHEQEELQKRERNVAFAQLGSCIHFMFSFGVRRPKIDAFVGRQAEIQDLSAEQYQLLTHNVLALHQMHSPHLYGGDPAASRMSVHSTEPVRMAHLSAQAERLSGGSAGRTGGEALLDSCPMPEVIPLVWTPTQASTTGATSSSSVPGGPAPSSGAELAAQLRSLVQRLLESGPQGAELLQAHLAESSALLLSQRRKNSDPPTVATTSSADAEVAEGTKETAPGAATAVAPTVTTPKVVPKQSRARHISLAATRTAR